MARQRQIKTALVIVAAGAILGGCANRSTPSASTSRSVDPKYGTSPSPRVVVSPRQRIPKGGGTYKVGVPYKVAGRTYIPHPGRGYDASGEASWYGTDFHGRKTANGEVFDMWSLTAAHPTLPMPSYAYVTNLDNGRTVLVRLNDRGPYAHNRIIDLSRMTARVLGIEQKGVGRVRVQYAGPAPLSGDDSTERRFLADQPWSAGQTVEQWAQHTDPTVRHGAFGNRGRMSLGVGLKTWEGYDKLATTLEVRGVTLPSSDGR
ncbi:MAG: hypothetical protein RL291_461 [Pseudomonadota bacterium]